MRPSQIRNLVVLVVLVAFLDWASSTAADFVIEYNWWKEIGQVNTWVSMLWYSIAPAAVGVGDGLRRALGGSCARSALRRDSSPGPPPVFPLGSRGLAVVAIVFASTSIDYWTRDALFRLPRAYCACRCLERSGFFARPAVLSFRFAFLFGSTRVSVRAGDSVRPCVLGDGARLAIVRTVPFWRLFERAETERLTLGQTSCDCREPRAPALFASSRSSCFLVLLPGFISATMSFCSTLTRS